jgi:ATP-dependent Zn protease
LNRLLRTTPPPTLPGHVKGKSLFYAGLISGGQVISPETRKLIDGEVQRLVTEQYERAQKLLMEHQPALKTLAVELLEHETVDGTAVKNALAAQASAKPDLEGAPLALVANG